MERVLATGADTLFCGHTHVPYVRNLENSSLTSKWLLHPISHPSTRPPPFSSRDAPRTTSLPFGAAARTGQASPTHSATPVPTLKRIINAGSVGEPRHGRPNATYVIYNTDTQAGRTPRS
jgi:diadenosine tetraphosphatase ApaH/serine/threonine PP2A family protein phosphatase